MALNQISRRAGVYTQYDAVGTERLPTEVRLRVTAHRASCVRCHSHSFVEQGGGE